MIRAPDRCPSVPADWVQGKGYPSEAFISEHHPVICMGAQVLWKMPRVEANKNIDLICRRMDTLQACGTAMPFRHGFNAPNG
ncbi:hypothetical protein HBH56_190350 [Parastagonospora nodorum]|uniref:Uncharacterized protein n=1 Tax=Phaeosphaeria nodorum (strain SN15 / ATCC MYA-4574 / FGSC 10173) TaxID=321614 RepID=A0A7U2HXL1_PHANO|nr:hypothetical protein HBH56_190350 [Parastagonospora nodorum]QRC92401.1 hypothetical protein JI435_428230 [Parastagonospora nodorum SN15]KAH3954467.1 hypothetical protein HBH53_025510 [Parastagonospora nodorum]KAH3967907.1 hypothetical protein HBH52_182950 [Parastagonospora nodorum]KAH3994620.1 hypothetical protein HBI10_182580 [Parastagonospora nodorum]